MSSGLASYHLRALAEAGFIAEDSELGTGRDRWWRASHEMTSWDADDVVKDATAAAMVDALRAHWYALRGHAEGGFEAGRQDWPTEWRRAAVYSNLVFRLTAEGLTDLQRQVLEFLKPWLTTSLARRDGGESTPDSAQTVMWFQSAVPVTDVAKILGAGQDPTEVIP